MSRALTFTLDLEDHRARRDTPARYPAITRELLPWLAQLGVRGTFFVVGEVAAAEPALIREVAAHGHELALHSYDHKPLTMVTPAQFRDDTLRGRDLLRDISGQAIVGYRAPVFSLTPASRWAVAILAELGFVYSSSVLAAPHPLYGYPGLPSVPFRWPEGLLELPAPLASLGPWRLPYLGGFYLRYLPLTLIQWLRTRATQEELPWTYCHPYDFDVDESFTPIRDAAWWVSVLLWCRRRGTRGKLARLLAAGCELPFVEQIARGDFVQTPSLA